MRIIVSLSTSIKCGTMSNAAQNSRVSTPNVINTYLTPFPIQLSPPVIPFKWSTIDTIGNDRLCSVNENNKTPYQQGNGWKYD